MLKRRNFLGAWHAKQYDGRPRKNPLFAHRDLLPRTKIFVGVGVFFVFIVALTWCLLASPWMTLAANKVEGLTTIDPARIDAMINEQRSYRRWFLFSQQNLIAFDEKKMTERLAADFSFESLSVAVDGKTVVVQAKEKILEIALKSGAKTFFLGLDGSVVREATPEEAKAIDVRLGLATPAEGETLPTLQPTMPILVDESAAEHPLFADEQIATILELNTLLRERNIDPKLFAFETLSAPWTRIETEQAYDIYFDIEKDFGTQITSLLTVLDQKANPEDPYEYIDVRFGDHVYVK